MTEVKGKSPLRRAMFWLRIAVALTLLAVLGLRVPWNDHIDLEARDGRRLVLRVATQVIRGDNRVFQVHTSAPDPIWTARVRADKGFELEQISVPAQSTAEGWGDAHGRWTPGLLPQMARLDPWLFAAASFLALAGTVLASARWRLLLAAQGIRLSLGRVVRLNLSGLAASQVLLGSIGGDVVKAGLVTRQSEEGSSFSTVTHAIFAIAVDRIVGLGALLTLGIAASITLSSDPHQLLRWFCGALAVLAIVLLCAFWLAGKSLSRPGTSLVTNAIRSLSSALASYRARPSVLALGFLLSLASHSALILGVATLGVGLGLPVPGLRYFQILPVVETLQAMPISPAGWGVAESSYVVLLGDIGVPAAQALSLAMCIRAVTLSQALIGVPFLLHLLRRNRRTASVDAAATAEAI